MLAYCQLDPFITIFSEILIKIQNFSLTKMHLKISSAKWRPFCPGGGVNPCHANFILRICISYHFSTLRWNRLQVVEILPCGGQGSINTLRLRQNGHHFPDDIFKCIFLNEYVWIMIKVSLKFVPKGPINNIPSLVQIMAWRRPGDKPLSEPMMVTRPQWVNPAKSMPWMLMTRSHTEPGHQKIW